MKHALFLGAVLALAAPALASAPERAVHGSRLVSKADPAVTVALPKDVVYVGADRWDLYDVADAELHVFVEANREKKVKALYWIQFEAYLPNNDHTYDYTKDEPVKFAGRDFWQRARFGPTGGTPREGSDQEHVQALLKKAGYTLPAESMNVRLVQVLDEKRRKELMFIYAEDLALTGHDVAELMDGKQPRAEWEPIKKALVERAMQRIQLSAP